MHASVKWIRKTQFLRMSSAIRVENLELAYQSEKLALKGISFSIEKGTYVCILGHNGSGKSTLAKILVGLLSDYKGEIYIFDELVSRKNINSLRSKIGIVFQNPDNQFVGSTVADDIAFGLENKAVPQKEMQPIIDRFVKSVGMEDYLDREPSSLSGGQKQRVALAGVLAMSPEILILDEATAMLDPKGKAEVDSLISSIRKEKPELTILSITHDLEEAAKADEVLVLNDGKLLLQGTPKSVFSYIDELKKASLDVPFIYKLIACLKEKGLEIPEDIDTIEKLGEYLCQ